MFGLVLSLIVLSNVVSGNAEGFYWRVFNGTIPGDAFPGGVDNAGNPTYIGQMYKHGYGLFPATIVNGSNNALAESHGQTFTTEKDVKILCSLEQDKFKWLKANAGEEYLIRGNSCPVVDGGSESNNEIIHIGRTVHNGETIVGRVFSYWKKYQGLHIPYNGGSVHVKSYQILTFDCKNYCRAN